MKLAISIAAAFLTYFILMKILFEDVVEFRSKLRSTLLFFPLAAAFDSVTKKVSLRVWFWLAGGLAVGLTAYTILP